MVQAELLRRVNGTLRTEISGSRQRSVWIRDLLAQEVLAPLGSERIGVPEAQAAEAAEVWRHATERIRSAGYAVHGDLADLEPAASADRLPGQVTEAELTEAAAACISSLVVTMRDRSAGPTPSLAPAPSPVPPGRRQRVRNLAVRAAGPYNNVRVRQLSRRVDELEREVQQARRLHLRIATLQDLVTELLLDPEPQDEGVTGRPCVATARSPCEAVEGGPQEGHRRGVADGPTRSSGAPARRGRP